MNKLKYIIIDFITLASNIFANTFPSGTWSCKTEKVKIDNYGDYIIINNKYKAFFQNTCIDSEGGRNCYVFKNKGYEYTIIWMDDDYEIIVSNKWGRNEQCR